MEHRQGAPDASGMICGGSQVVVVSPLGAAQRADLAAVVDALASGRQIDGADRGGRRMGMARTAGR